MKHKKKLQPFKRKLIVPSPLFTADIPDNVEQVYEQEVLPAIQDGNNVTVFTSPPPVETILTTILTQVENAGYPELAAKLKDLQISEGVEKLDPLFKRIGMLENQVDDLLSLGYPMPVEEISRLLSITRDAFRARSQALLLPQGSVSPRSIGNRQKGDAPVRVAIGIGNGISPRGK